MEDTIKHSLLKTMSLQLKTVSTPYSLLDNKSEIKLYLIQKQYDALIIENLLFFYEITSVDQALNLLKKDVNGIWQHQRINTTSLTCLICNEIDTPHISDFISPHSDSIILKVNKYNNEDYLCSICLGGIISNLNLSFKCGHKFCLNCYQTYIETKISTRDILCIKCLQYKCESVFTDNDIKKIFYNKEDTYQKYLFFKEKKINEIENLKKKSKPCPEINCEGWLKYDKKNKFVICDYGHKYCYNCLEPWHPNKKLCKSVIDKDFQVWKKGKTIKRCPKCKYFTEKIYGCNHIICANCKFHWCWLCLKEYSDEHFNSGKCQGLQFSEWKFIENQCCFECFSIFCYLRYFYLFILFVLVFAFIGGPISFISIYFLLFEENSTFSDMGLSSWIMVATCGFLGVYLQPICLLLGTLVVFAVLSISIVYPPFTKKFQKLFQEKF